MHNVIAGAPQVDHVNGDGLDNRRANLRPASTAQNARNRSRPSTNRSGFKGVSWVRDRGHWRAGIKVDGRSLNLGSFADPVEAAKAYDEAARRLHGKFARPNFPEVLL